MNNNVEPGTVNHQISMAPSLNPDKPKVEADKLSQIIWDKFKQLSSFVGSINSPRCHKVLQLTFRVFSTIGSKLSDIINNCTTLCLRSVFDAHNEYTTARLLLSAYKDQQAKTHLKRAAQMGHEEAKLALNLLDREEKPLTTAEKLEIADTYYSGNLVPGNWGKAAYYYNEVLKNSEGNSNKHALERLANIYHKGSLVTPRNLEQAGICYERLAQDGDPEALDKLIQFLEEVFSSSTEALTPKEREAICVKLVDSLERQGTYASLGRAAWFCGKIENEEDKQKALDKIGQAFLKFGDKILDEIEIIPKSPEEREECLISLAKARKCYEKARKTSPREFPISRFSRIEYQESMLNKSGEETEKDQLQSVRSLARYYGGGYGAASYNIQPNIKQAEALYLYAAETFKSLDAYSSLATLYFNHKRELKLSDKEALQKQLACYQAKQKLGDKEPTTAGFIEGIEWEIARIEGRL